VSSRKKKSLGRDPFADRKKEPESKSVERLITRRASGKPGAREVVVSVRLTPSAIKHLDSVRARLHERGRTDITRDDLIRIAITLLSADDIT
jgi:hypothetical protein